jgi:tRNA threonylcarbamoyladenosine biosynthesis protein TsaE
LTTADHTPGIVGTPPPAPVKLLWADEDATRAFARRLAAAPGIRHAFIALHGDLGTGKTTFVRYLLQALGVDGRIKSPTYAVVEPHQATGPDGAWEAWHFDFYRFDDPREWDDAGFRDIFASLGLKLAEWPEKAAGMLPDADLDISMEVDEFDVRHVAITASTAIGALLLQASVDPGNPIA